MIPHSSIAVLLLAVTLVAQEPAATVDEAAHFAPVSFGSLPNGLRYRAVPVDGVAHTALVLTVRCGSLHDPALRSGLARVIATVMRLALAGDADAAQPDIAVRALDAATTFAVLVEREQVEAALDRLRVVFDGPAAAAGAPFDDDAVARATAQSKLQIDDETETLPGPIAFAWARAKLWPHTARGRPANGVASQLDGIDAEFVRGWLAANFRVERASLVAVGAVEVDGFTESLARRFGGQPADSGSPSPSPVPAVGTDGGLDTAADLGDAATIEAGADALEIREHRLVDAPFVTAAWRAPSYGEADCLAFLIGMGALRARAARQFTGYRGGELRAGFEFVNFRFLDQPGVVLVNRRGRDGDPVDRVQAEIEGLFADLRAHGLDDVEIALSMRELVQTLVLPPYDAALRESMSQYPALLHARAYVLAMFDLYGWPERLPELLQKTPVADVRRVLRSTLAKDGLRWFALVPAEASADASGRGR